MLFMETNLSVSGAKNRFLWISSDHCSRTSLREFRIIPFPMRRRTEIEFDNNKNVKYSNEFKFVAKSALFANINCPFLRNEWANTQTEQCIAWIAWNYGRIFAIALIRPAAVHQLVLNICLGMRVYVAVSHGNKRNGGFSAFPLCVTFARVRIRNAIKKCKWPVGLTIGSAAKKKLSCLSTVCRNGETVPILCDHLCMKWYVVNSKRVSLDFAAWYWPTVVGCQTKHRSVNNVIETKVAIKR